jgi:Polyketide cyclase / dehydrase and lipid transport
LLSAATAFADPVSETQVNVADVSKTGATGKSYVAETIIAAPVSKLCGIVNDYAAYPSFMPNTAEARVVQSTESFALVDMTLKLPMGKVKKYRLRMEPKNTPALCHLAWKLVPQPELKQEETIADTSGYWDLTPTASDKNKTMVKYYVYSDPGPVPMGFGWIVDSLGKDSLPKTLEALRAKSK